MLVICRRSSAVATRAYTLAPSSLPVHFFLVDIPSPGANSLATAGRLLTLWGSHALRTLYVVVDPVHLRNAEKPRHAPADRS
ncbi:hypothetical protein LX36DRAFT_140319 [Colletotrichum falcatum]|nr:hypothetical protein LX36DRAFT_140319 [Colletotrichum falcatum]